MRRRILDGLLMAACMSGLLGMTGCSSGVFDTDIFASIFGSSDAASYARQGSDAMQKGDAAGAEKLFTQAIDAKTLGPLDSANALLDRGLAREKQAKHQDALADFSAALALNALPQSDRARAQYDRGVALDELGHMQDAVDAFSEALTLQPQFAAAYNNRANAHLRLGDLAAAKSDYEAALAANIPSPEYVYYGLGQIAQAEGDFNGARDCYKKALAANPHYDLASARLAELDKLAVPHPLAPQAATAPKPHAPASSEISLRPSIDALTAPAAPAAMPRQASASQIQLGAYRDEATATETWNRLIAQTGGLLHGLTPSIVSVDLPERGRFYRLRADVSDGTAAASLCGQLKSRGFDCIRVKG